MGSFEEKLTRKIQVSLMHICKYPNQRARTIGNRMDYLSKLFQKQKKRKST